VGGAAQIKAMKQVAGQLRLQLAQYRELQAFTQFSAELDKATQLQLARGDKLVQLLKQPQYKPMPVEEQVMVLYVGTRNYLDDIPTEAVERFAEEFLSFMREHYPRIGATIKKEKEISPQTEEELKKAIDHFKEVFQVDAGKKPA
jgi:F-type H+-transporting ATPase subunit alpha